MRRDAGESPIARWREKLRGEKDAPDIIELDLERADEDVAPSAFGHLRDMGGVAWAVTAGWLALMGLLAAWYLWDGGPFASLKSHGAAAEGVFLAPWLIAAVVCSVAAIGSGGRRRWAWALIAAGMFSWAGAEIYDYVHTLTSDTALPTPAVTDAGWLGAVAWWFAGVWLMARGNRGLVTEFRSVVDTLIGVAAIGIVIWSLVIQQGIDHYINSDGMVATATNFAYPLFDFGLLAAVLFGVTATRMRGDVVRWGIVAALAGITMADLVYFREFFIHGDGSGLGDLQDMGWTLGASGIALAAAWHRLGVGLDPGEEEPAVEPAESRLAPPFVFLSVTLGVLVFQSLNASGVKGPAVVGVVVVALLMMLRLHLSFRENRELLMVAQHQALTDALTGLASRRYFEQRLAEEVSRTRRGEQVTCVVLIDVDHFKEVNDGFGHDVGDRYLGEIARSMRIVCRGSDVPCRIGGDEFAIIAPGTNLEGASVLAERVREGVATVAEEVLGGRLGGTISVGICSMPEGAETMEDLLKNADNALYQAKETRNAIVAHRAESPVEG